ncbi:hypothetical protein [Ferruginibacter sp. HRS2-29]|uniref:hypothetical protein n=1 Tax=Ferruginibacter sp. HRS2-29 TaxID=2487334 RepID=UPI0020CD380E|nr:hypothetical protein [Ferruginibacter sp. HRS2-29]
MKKKAESKIPVAKASSKKDLTRKPAQDKEVKKGYNEKNPGQPQGAFKPDNASSNN